VLDAAGSPNKLLFDGQSRGIVFDLGHGAGSFWFRNAVPAMQNGFWPDSISTDLHIRNVHGAVVDMQTTMSKLLNIGMPLQEVILRSTVAPAREIHRPELGHLSDGNEADVAVFKLLHGDFAFVDCGNAKMKGDRKLECAMTLRAGKVVFDPGGLSMPTWQDAPAEYWQIHQ
jgi:dihydroorotase